MRCLVPWLWCALFACDPGALSAPDGDTPIRTAWWSPTDDPTGWRHLSVFLSSGDFPCALPDSGDPAAQEAAVIALIAASCHEGARHVSLDAWHPPGEDGTGWFRGDTRAVAGDALTLSRFSRGTWRAITEVAVDTPGQFAHSYRVTGRDVFELGAPGGIDVQHLDEDGLVGQFAFPDAHVSGAFTATRCGPGSGLQPTVPEILAAYGGDPTLLCD